MTKKEINRGKVVGNIYFKYLSFSETVLWNRREISIAKDVAEEWLGDNTNVNLVVFVDQAKRETWKAKLDRIKTVWQLKRVGQEPQYYIPIDIFITKTYGKKQYE